MDYFGIRIIKSVIKMLTAQLAARKMAAMAIQVRMGIETAFLPSAKLCQ
jgi:hypothetical protein